MMVLRKRLCWFYPTVLLCPIFFVVGMTDRSKQGATYDWLLSEIWGPVPPVV